MAVKIPRKASIKKPPSYVVGYRKPPKSTQFKPGQSGNPNGRPKGQKSLADLALAEAARLVKVQIGSTVHHLSRKQALMRKLFEMALHGNLKAAQMGLSFLAEAEAAAGLSPAFEAPLSEAEIAILKDTASLSKKGAGP